MNFNADMNIVALLASNAKGEHVEADKLREANEYCAELLKDFGPENRHKMAQLIGFAVNELTQPVENYFATIGDLKTIGFGDKAGFRVRKGSIRAYIQAKDSTTQRSKVARDQILVDTVEVSARPAMNVSEMLTGRVSVSDLIRDAAIEITNAQLGYVQNVLKQAVASWGTGFYGGGAGVVAATLDPMVQRWMRTGGAVIVGDIAAVSKLAELTGFTAAANQKQFSPNIIDEFNQFGYIGSYKGAKVICLANPYTADMSSPVLDPGMLYILPAGADLSSRPLKIVKEGGIRAMEFTNIDANLYEIRMDQYIGAAVAVGVNPMMSVYEDTSL